MKQIIVNNIALDNEQLNPILDNPKYALIIAGAGTGKTLTMIGKVKYLLENNYAKSQEILGISFTNEAVNSLKNKIKENTGCDIDTFTFHRLALNILKENNVNYSILSSDYLDFLIDEFFNTYCFNNKGLVWSYFKYHHIFFKSKRNYNKLIKSDAHKRTKKLIITFLNLFSSNNLNKNSWNGILKLSSKHEKNILNIIYAIYLLYLGEKKSTQRIDFDDMIKEATDVVKKGKKKLPYKYILIDEFQDTSPLRFNLIKEILKNTDASLCCVGDDFQSIYHFSGCDIELFLNFKKMMPEAKIYKLERTYRNSQELINLAGNFVSKNPYQVKKHLISNKHLNKPIKLVYYENKKRALLNVLKMINSNEELFILGRNNFDLRGYFEQDEYTLNGCNLVLKKYHDLKIKYLTIHSAKGLEADNVIILNMENGIYGIPSLLEDEKILRFVKKTFLFPYEEERRLFYVGLTRTKGNVYLMIPSCKRSRFIDEIKNSNDVEKIHLN